MVFESRYKMVTFVEQECHVIYAKLLTMGRQFEVVLLIKNIFGKNYTHFRKRSENNGAYN